MKAYKLLTPGPLTTTDSVKQQMLFDHCTWDDEYKQITIDIQNELLSLARVDANEYSVVLMQGSGSFGVESVLTSVVGNEDKILIISNGAYGKRMQEMADHAKVPYVLYEVNFDEVPQASVIAEIVNEDTSITHIAMVHSETTSGILNDIEAVGKVAKANSLTYIVDAMSSFGGIDIPMKDFHIDFIVSSANKCIQGVPGFSFIIANSEKLVASAGKARSLSLDLYDQHKTMQKDGKWRFTSPTHVVLAFHKALQELKEEGGIQARYTRYRNNNTYLIERFAQMGMKSYVAKENQGPIITTFYYPENANFTFEEMYTFIKEKGYAIYPGKLTDAQTFRVGNIGEIYQEDMEALCTIMEAFLKAVQYG